MLSADDCHFVMLTVVWLVVFEAMAVFSLQIRPTQICCAFCYHRQVFNIAD